MKFKSLSVLVFILSILACKEQEEKPETEEENSTIVNNEVDSIAPPRETSIPTRQCYLYDENGDTITLEMEQTDTRISGSLAYLWAEKDQNTGSISGEIKGDTIFADYTFTSEGKESVREVVFLKKDDQLLEGYAPITERNGKTVFESENFDFEKSPVLGRTDCKM